ncbi:hypothetical protein RB598_005529 [Gaeumannomyces tritici]
MEYRAAEAWPPRRGKGAFICAAVRADYCLEKYLHFNCLFTMLGSFQRGFPFLFYLVIRCHARFTPTILRHLGRNLAVFTRQSLQKEMAVLDCCLRDTGDLEKPELQPYPDISGIGVIVAFVGTAFIALFLLICNYLISYDPSSNPFSTPLEDALEDQCTHCGHGAPTLPVSTTRTGNKKNDADWWRPNPIDTMFLQWVRRVVHKGLPFLARLSSRRISDAFVECIILASDTQLLTGIAILTSGFLSLGCGSGPNISAYHWQMVVHLAWFAMATHLASLSVLRSYLRRHPHRRLFRFLLTLLLLVLLLVAAVPTVFFNWRERYFEATSGREEMEFTLSAANASSPAVCFFNIGPSRSKFSQIKDHYMRTLRDPESISRYSEFPSYRVLSLAGGLPNLQDTPAFQGTVFSTAILLVAFFNRTVKLFRPLSFVLYLSLRPIVGTSAQDACSRWLEWTMPTKSKLVRAHLWRSLIFRPSVALLVSARMLVDLATSQLINIYLLLFAVFWATCRLAEGRRSTDAAIVSEEENKWTFGQTLPLLLLAAPILALFSAFFTKLTPDMRRVLSKGEIPGRSSETTVARVTGTYEPGVPSHSTEKGIIRAALRCNYYAIAPWTVVCAGILTCCVLTTLTPMPALYFGMPSGDSPLTYFVRTGLLFQLVLGLPCACFSATLIGLAVQQHLAKRLAFFLYIICAAVSFCGGFVSIALFLTSGEAFKIAELDFFMFIYWAFFILCVPLLLLLHTPCLPSLALLGALGPHDHGCLLSWQNIAVLQK